MDDAESEKQENFKNMQINLLQLLRLITNMPTPEHNF